jgi:radical SAM superfamily enzyme YgiQ (UPF0313 family)
MHKLLLINPWIYDFTAYDLWSKPLGLLYLASFLRKLGYKIRYIDCTEHYPNETKPSVKAKKYGAGHYSRQVIEKPDILKHIPRNFARYGINEDNFTRRLLEYRDSDAVLLTSMMTYWYPGLKRAVELVRKHLPGKPVILGGVYATLLPDHARRQIQPDYLITGPGEIKVAELLAVLSGGDIAGAAIPETLDDYPWPAFDLIKQPRYLVALTSRGCPYSCSICAQSQIAMPFAQRSPEAVVAEIMHHGKVYRVQDFAFYDDALFINRDHHIKRILEMLIRQRIPLRFHTPNGLFARQIDPELAELMYKSAFKTVRLSFETSDDARKMDLNSKVSNEDMIKAVANLTAAGYKASDLEAYVLMGLPSQSMEEVIASILFAHSLGIIVRLAFFSPIPGTLEFRRAVASGLIPEDVDPLITNKSIFMLSTGLYDGESFRKVTDFAQALNELARRNLRQVTDVRIGAAVSRIVKEMQ